MSGMASTFSVNIRVTLLFTNWVTETPIQYACALIFLFILGLFNRFLAALRSQLESRWTEHADAWGSHNSARPRSGPRLVGHNNATEELEPLSPAPPGVTVDTAEKAGPHRRKGIWVAYSAWSGRRDTIRAAFEFVRAVAGYVLMLAVMTYNVGFFFAVTGSVLLGELAFGRYTHSGTGGKWQEGGCHE
ncbi:hypothetical protein K458DRAFT_342713 [Lentithecium fluviatile CBS 122367]|uniref:Copper transport protein n=1 Tax=Lentithecium fluviatile CBS 122367 TaxID=1168545 RepID=A0A6G1IVI7_9PLEO|nr:hypothetical protein K458DRAFT_342713 [Lentithecium fluviatile CBS 122367]